MRLEEKYETYADIYLNAGIGVGAIVTGVCMSIFKENDPIIVAIAGIIILILTYNQKKNWMKVYGYER